MFSDDRLETCFFKNLCMIYALMNIYVFHSIVFDFMLINALYILMLMFHTSSRRSFLILFYITESRY